MGWVLNATPEVNNASEYPMIIAITVSLSVLASSVVGARLYRRWKVHCLEADDWMSALSMFFALIYSSICIAQTRYGLGLPIPLRPKENLISYTRVNFSGRPFYQLGISFFKVALLISYLRLLRGTTGHKTYRRIILMTIALVFTSHVGCTLALIFACTPVDKSWNPLKEGKCLAAGPSFTGYAVVTIVSDVVVAMLPIPILMKLEIKKGKKIGLIVIFMLGIFTTICSIQRYLQIDRIQNPKDGNSTMLVLWGVIEFNVGNIVSSLPFLAPIFLKRARQYRSKQSGYNTPSQSKGLKYPGYKLKDLSHPGKIPVYFHSTEKGSRTESQEKILDHDGVVYILQVPDRAAESNSDIERL
ncbi:integral membrane protein [Fusarium austroafricanum]|uniref:Integral membrane protein n=1 Tax=Fusarium austroafricanum TaxID=2364996 RepID=A0A8H4NS79_9HYPO|nr:integral membrane protein [Fusarium austroafricanum]